MSDLAFDNDEYTVSLVMGARRSGKTVYAQSLIKALPAHVRILVIDTIPDHPKYADVQLITLPMLKHWKKGIKKIVVSEDTIDELAKELNNLFDCFFLFEDIGKYLFKGIPRSICSLCMNSKQRRSDILFLSHGPGDVDKDLYRYLNCITVFKLSENLEPYRTYIPRFYSVRKAFREVMNNTSKFHNITVRIF